MHIENQPTTHPPHSIYSNFGSCFDEREPSKIAKQPRLCATWVRSFYTSKDRKGFLYVHLYICIRIKYFLTVVGVVSYTYADDVCVRGVI